MADHTSTRIFIQQRIGGRWRSLCITPERDNLGNPVTIDHIGEDTYASHFQSSLMPIETARSISERLAKDYGQRIHFDPSVSNDPGYAVLRISTEKAEALLKNESFRADTKLDSLYVQFERTQGMGRS